MQTLAHARMTVVRPSGTINAKTAIALKQQLADTVASPDVASLLVDLSQVDLLDSAGLMALVSTMTLAQQLNKRFGLIGISPSVRIIFELTQLDRVFEIFENQPMLDRVAA